jgi:PAS domain S-box-containing protein
MWPLHPKGVPMETQRPDFESMMATMPMAAVAVDPAMKVTFVNEAAVQLLGCDPQESLGSKLKDILGGKVGKKGDPLTDALKAGKPCTLESYGISSSEGEDLHVNVTSAPVEHDGKPIGSIIYLQHGGGDAGAKAKVDFYEAVHVEAQARIDARNALLRLEREDMQY